MRSDPIEITVTEVDIICGKREDCCECPWALATKRAFPAASEVNVDYGTISFYHGDQVFMADTPEKVLDWMDDYDTDRRPVKPTSASLVFEILDRAAEDEREGQ